MISFDDFLLIKNIETDLNIKNKYKNLFDKFDCFSNVIVLRNTKKHITHNHHNSTPNPNRKPRDITRIITGLLNILNNTNYNKIFVKLKLLIQNDNIVYIMNEILTKAVLQIFFIDIYSKLIYDIISFFYNKEIIFEVLSNFIVSYLSENNFDIPEETIEYNDFCMNQKKKLTIISTNKLILYIIKYYPHIMDIKTYSRYIDNFITTSRLHVLVPIINDIVVYMNFKDFNNLHLLTKGNNISKKSEFMITDLLNKIF